MKDGYTDSTMNVDVCTPTYLRIYSRWNGKTRIEGSLTSREGGENGLMASNSEKNSSGKIK